MSEDQQRQLMDDIAGAMGGVPEAILRRQISHFAKADPAYGEGVARRVGLAALEPAE
jgi:catalase